MLPCHVMFVDACLLGCVCSFLLTPSIRNYVLLRHFFVIFISFALSFFNSSVGRGGGCFSSVVGCRVAVILVIAFDGSLAYVGLLFRVCSGLDLAWCLFFCFFVFFFFALHVFSFLFVLSGI